MKRIKAEGVSSVTMRKGEIPLFEGNELVLRSDKSRRARAIVLPTRPKWMRNASGKMVRFPPDAVNFVEEFRVDSDSGCLRLDSGKNRGRTGKKARNLDNALVTAMWLLACKDEEMDEQMMERCSWVCKVFRQRPCMLPEFSQDDGKGKGYAFQLLTVVGG